MRNSYDLNGNVTSLTRKGVNSCVTIGVETTSTMGASDLIGPIGPIKPIKTETTLLTMDYCGDMVYRNGQLERTLNDYGYRTDSTYHYYIKDYQGNIRAVIDQNGELEEINNYYPYGGLMGAATAGLPARLSGRQAGQAGVQPLKYGGKELDRQNGLDLLDFSARHYDMMLPMFTTFDPLGEKNPGRTPYGYCAGNPIRNIDPTGMLWLKSQWGDDTYYMYDKDINNEADLQSKYGKDANLSIIGADKDNIEVSLKHPDGELAGTVMLDKNGNISANGNTVVEYNYSSAYFSNLDNYTFDGNFIIKKIFGLEYNYFNTFYIGHMNPKIDGKDSRALPPINLLDYAAQQHDLDYNQLEVAGISGVASLKTLNADIALTQRSAMAALRADLGSKQQMAAIATTMLFLKVCSIKSVLSLVKSINF